MKSLSEAFNVLVILVFGCLFLECFAATTESEIKFSDDNGQTDGKDLSSTYNLVLKAGYYANNGKISKALSTFDEIFLQQVPLHVYELYFKLLLEAGQTKQIVEIYNKKEVEFTEKLSSNLDFWMVVAQAHLVSNFDKKSEEIFVKLAKNFPDNDQVAYNYATAMLKNNQADKAINYLDKCVKRPLFKQRYFLFYYLRSKAHLQKGNFSLAMKDIEKSLELDSHFYHGILVKAMLLQQQGKINEAIKGYTHFLSIVGKDEMVEKQIIQLLFFQKKYDDAAKYLKQLRGDTVEYYFELAVIQLNAQRYKQALNSINLCLKKVPNLMKAKLLKIDILLSLKDYKQTLSFVNNWLEMQPIDPNAINTLILLSKTPININDIIKLLENLSLKRTSNIDILAALSDLYVENKMYKDALNTLKKINDLTVNDELKSKVLFHMAHLYFNNNEIEKAENILQDALQKSLMFPQSYNLIAYIYAQKGKDLNQALEMSDKALEFDKYSPFYLDTKGCVLLKMGNFKDALDLFERASNISPGDQEILNHIATAKGQILTEVERFKVTQNEK